MNMLVRITKQHLAGVLLAVGIVATLSAQAADSKAYRYYEDALTKYERKDVRGAIIQLKNAIQADQRLLAAHVLLGKTLLESGDPIGAEVEFDESLRQGANRAEVITFLGQAYLQQGKYNLLLERVTPNGLPVAPQVGVLVLRANALVENGSVADASRVLEEARMLDPNSAMVRLAQANIGMRKGDMVLAKKLSDEALSLGPNNAGAWNVHGSLLQASGDREGALQSYAKASALSPQYIEPRIARSGLLIDLGRIDEAERELAMVKKIAPQEPRSAYFRALIAKSRGDKGATKTALEEVTRVLDPLPFEMLANNKAMLLLDALAHYGLGNKEKAADKLQVLLRRYPDDDAGTKLLARQHLDNGNYTFAISLLEPLKRRSPNDPRVLSLLATAYMQDGNFKGASELLDQAVRESGGAVDIATDFGISLAGTGKAAQAIEQLRQAWTKDPKQTRTGMILCTLYLRSGQAKKALEVVEVLVKKDPSNIAVLNMLGVARVALGDRAGGRNAYEQILARDPGHQGAIFNLSSLEQAEGKLDEARKRLLALLKGDEKNVNAMMELASIDEKARRNDGVVRWLEKARSASNGSIAVGARLTELYLQRGEVDKALGVATETLNKNQKSLAAFGLLARAQLAKGDSSSARQTLGTMARYAGYDPVVQVEVARLQLAAGNDSGANYSLDKSLSNQPNFPPALMLRAEIEIRQREFTKAEQHISQISKIPGSSGVVASLKGDLAMAQGQYATALTAYNDALKKSDGPRMVLRLYRAYAAMGDLPKGTKFLQKWQGSHPGDATVLRTIGDAELRLGGFAAARIAYEKALKLLPDDGLIWNNIAQAAFAQKDGAATSYAERAYSLRPTDPIVIDTLGWIMLQQGGTLDRALALLRDARLRNPNDPEIRYHLAEALAKSGRTDEAREELAQALRGNVSFSGVGEARRLQAALGR
ncbi:MAG: PEP-CTERM system TPR-repeat protein PrsT [Betaproteobacteria bacterium HGW-Betaproteobacteria-6]|jgi:putative PEP-CTERM system TPR-repeat lipoprotein|nr:MAG: PEP-CTERM system TPR-repeat protein PrsT [Betaproteobacteria bacterium HGW-Betaproteobacteria-6]